MNKLMILVLWLLSSGLLSADELLLKNGGKIVWKSIEEEEDYYSVMTKDGKKIKVNKSDVEKFIIEEKVEKPLTGASFSLDQKKVKAVDLLLKADTKPTKGVWKIQGGALTADGPSAKRSVVSFDFEGFTDEYDLFLIAERTDSDKADLDVGITTSEGQCAFHFDAWSSTVSCLALIDGGEGEHIEGQVFRKGKPRTIKVMVRKASVLIQVDGKDFWKSKVEWGRTSLLQDLKGIDSKKIFLAVAGGTWKISNFTVASLNPR